MDEIPPQNPADPPIVNGNMAGQQQNNEFNHILMADNRDVAMREYAATAFQNLDSVILNPIPEAANIELKPLMFQMLQTLGQFGGREHEDPHDHLKTFLQIAGAFRFPNITDDALRHQGRDCHL
ncbi:uncharacterized protein LOC111018524 [Momordica charantia]|uniref:Uncharacterized protein LOC111018524 n=1 Tax=Momordica charantia TaxID=3673 RepID=A0A6J1DAG1_MOMCH|nr:uncharacterized protein LOC111018524 [Momordica charantia]